MMNKISTISASDARADLYNLIKLASRGMQSYEIVLRGSEPVILMSKADLESWIETFDVMSDPQLVKAIREGEKEEGGITLDELLAELDNKDKHGKSHLQKTRKKRVGATPKKRT